MPRSKLKAVKGFEPTPSVFDRTLSPVQSSIPLVGESSWSAYSMSQKLEMGVLGFSVGSHCGCPRCATATRIFFRSMLTYRHRDIWSAASHLADTASGYLRRLGSGILARPTTCRLELPTKINVREEVFLAIEVGLSFRSNVARHLALLHSEMHRRPPIDSVHVRVESVCGRAGDLRQDPTE